MPQPFAAPFPLSRPRRLRRTPALRALTRETAMTPDNLIWPIFLQAGKDAGTYGRVTELTEDRFKLAQMESEGKLKTVFFTDRQKLIDAAAPVLAAYFKELNSEALFKAIQAVK